MSGERGRGSGSRCTRSAVGSYKGALQAEIVLTKLKQRYTDDNNRASVMATATS